MELHLCLDRKEYKEQCTVYCEQFLYWFLGPEVQWPNSKCSADGVCTFSSANAIATTNGYQFSAGLLTTLTDAFKLAFNLGATYTWQYQTTTTQTSVQTKPKDAEGKCGYWTFLPYYVT